jgi:hypothetical protein
MLTHTHHRGLTAGGVKIQRNVDVQAEQELILDLTLVEGASNVLHALTVDVSQIKSIFISTDDANILVETNSAGSPVNVFTVVDGQPFMWGVGDGTLRDTAETAVTTDITALYLTNSGTEDARVRICILVDPTV